VGGYDPSINHLIIVEANDGITHEFDTNTNNDYHRVTGLGETTQMYYLLYAGRYDDNGYYIDDGATLAIMEAFLSSIELRPPWLSLSSESGTIPIGESTTLDVAFNASDIAGGTHSAVIQIVSNDEDEPQVNIPVSLTANIPYPNITVTPDSLNEHLFYGDSSIQSIVISNDGTADLNWNLSILDYGRDGMSYTFTNCDQEGRYGPSQDQCNSVYEGTSLEGEVVLNEGIQQWTVPQSGTYTIEVYGASSGHNNYGLNGYGAKMSGNFSLNSGDVINILIGQQGGTVGGPSGAGGGGTFVTYADNSPIIIAGGGSGACNGWEGAPGLTTESGGGPFPGTDGNGGGCYDDGVEDDGGGAGGGFYTNGCSQDGCCGDGGFSFLNGGVGANDNGGFGGGGGHWNGGSNFVFEVEDILESLTITRSSRISSTSTNNIRTTIPMTTTPTKSSIVISTYTTIQKGKTSISTATILRTTISIKTPASSTAIIFHTIIIASTTITICARKRASTRFSC
jgi:hypothetical protein